MNDVMPVTCRFPNSDFCSAPKVNPFKTKSLLQGNKYTLLLMKVKQRAKMELDFFFF